MSDWESCVEELDELDDIRAYDEAKTGPQDSVEFEQALRQIVVDEWIELHCRNLAIRTRRLKKIAREARSAIAAAIRDLANNPRPPGCKSFPAVRGMVANSASAIIG